MKDHLATYEKLLAEEKTKLQSRIAVIEHSREQLEQLRKVLDDVFQAVTPVIALPVTQGPATEVVVWNGQPVKIKAGKKPGTGPVSKLPSIPERILQVLRAAKSAIQFQKIVDEVQEALQKDGIKIARDVVLGRISVALVHYRKKSRVAHGKEKGTWRITRYKAAR